MTIEEIYKKKKYKNFLKAVFTEAYDDFEAMIEDDENFSLSTDEIIELFYDLTEIHIKNLK
jgi:hypothetical protein